MKSFKEKYLELALQYASFQKQGFETTPVIKSELAKFVRKSNAVRDKLVYYVNRRRMVDT